MGESFSPLWLPPDGRGVRNATTSSLEAAPLFSSGVPLGVPKPRYAAPLGDAAGEAEAARKEALSPAPPTLTPSRDAVRPETTPLCREEGEPRSGVDFPAEEEEDPASFLSEEELLEPESDDKGKGFFLRIFLEKSVDFQLLFFSNSLLSLLF